MPVEDTIDAVFKQLRRDFTAQTKRSFLRDIRGQIEDDETILAIMGKAAPEKAKYVAVTFDRRKNDNLFSYSYFDLILVVLDALCGGTGIYKPSNQMRMLKWNGTRANLLTVLRYFGRNNTQVKFRRALVLPSPLPLTGYKIDTRIHMK